MFAFAAMPVKFVALLVLFGWCTVWCGYELVRAHGRRQLVSDTAHLAMAVVMLLMVAGPTWTALTALVPTTVLAVAFAVATAWFVWLAVDGFRACDRRAGWHFSGHAAMFTAMTWHLAAMAVKAGHGGHSHGDHGTGDAGGGMDHGAMGHGAMSDAMPNPMSDAMPNPMGGAMPNPMGTQQWMTQAQQPGGVLWLFALVGLPLMAYLLVASVVAVRNLARRPQAANAGQPAPVGAAGSVSTRPETPARGCHDDRPMGSLQYRLAALSDFAMNFGMFWMSTGLLVPILPFFAGFSF